MRRSWLTRVLSILGRHEPPAEERAANLWWPREAAPQCDPLWWAKGADSQQPDAMRFGPVYACIAIIAQEIARLPLSFFIEQPDGSRQKLPDSWIGRVLRRPNSYQTRSDFWLFMIRSLLLDGNAYALAQRNGRGEVMALHPRHPQMVWPYVVPETAEIFYSVSRTPLAEQVIEPSEALMVPQRDMLQIRLFTPGHPLVGETPIAAAVYSVVSGIAIQRSTSSFFSRQARPSGILRTPRKLSKEAAERIQASWSRAYSGDMAGSVAVLEDDLTWQALTMSAVDADVVKQYELSVDDVARIFRVPPWMLGRLEKTTFRNIETQQRHFYASCLGFYLEHVEAALDSFFGLPPTEECEFEFERGMMRAELDTRMDAYGKGIQGGVMTPNEARRLENLPPVPGGDNCFLQAQMIPVSSAAEAGPKRPETPPPDEEPEPDEPDETPPAITDESWRQELMRAVDRALDDAA
jgi:HK97 family phage portal protein